MEPMTDEPVTSVTKATLCLLSYMGIWLRGRILNRQPPGYEPDELPTAPPRVVYYGGEGWIEPAKASPADYSLPFGQLGNLSTFFPVYQTV